MENYKKWLIVAIIAGVAAIVVFAANNSKHNKPALIPERTEIETQAGPMLGPEPIKQASAFPDDPKQLADIGDTYFENQNFDQAMIVYEKALKLDPNDVDTYNDLGLAYLYTGRVEKAVATLKKGTEVGPNYQRIWLTMGYTYLSLKNENEARPALEMAFKLNPETTVGKEAKRLLDLVKK